MGLAGCSAFISVDDPQCREDSDCVRKIGRNWVCSDEGLCLGPDDRAPDEPEGLSEEWACLEEEPREVLPNLSESVTLRFASVDYQTLLVPEGLTARACNLTDADCEKPLVEDVTPDEEGYFEFQVPKGFSGFFEIKGEGVLPTLFYANKGYGEDLTFPGPVLVDPSTVVKLSMRGAIAADLSKGLAILVFWDCNGGPGAGVSMERNGGEPGEVFYFDGAVPDRDLTASRAARGLVMNRERIAAAGITNIPPGFQSFDVWHEASMLPFSSYTAEIRSGYMTTIYMFAGY